MKPDTQDPRLTSGTIALLHSDISWQDVPEAFRMIVDKKRFVKLVRNASDVLYHDAFSPWIIKPQKTALLSSMSALTDDVEIAVSFNGLDLTIYGILLTEGEGV